MPLVWATAVSVQLRIPYEVVEDFTYVQPNATLRGVVTVVSQLNEVLHCRAKLLCHNCTISPEEFTAVLRLKYDTRAVPVEVKLGNRPAELRAVVICNSSVAVARKLFVPATVWKVDIEVVWRLLTHSRVKRVG